MRILDLYKDYRGMEPDPYKDITEKQARLAWICDGLFDITTYDDDISVKFGEAIIEIMRAIHKRKGMDYAQKSDAHYVWFLLVANLLNAHSLIDWGCSIRSCWLSDYKYGEKTLIQSKAELEYLLNGFAEGE